MLLHCQTDATGVMKVKGTDALTAHDHDGVNIGVNRSYRSCHQVELSFVVLSLHHQEDCSEIFDEFY